MVSMWEIKSAVQLAEKESRNGANGFTLLKFRKTPVDFLVSIGAIGPTELAAAHEFSWVFESLTSDLRFCSINQEASTRQKTENNRPATKRETEAWGHYKEFSNYWSARKKQHGDLTLAIMVAAVIDQMPLEAIAVDYNLSQQKARDVIIRGLRDYAVRAGWVASGDAVKWTAAALKSFDPKRRLSHPHPKDSTAVKIA